MSIRLSRVARQFRAHSICLSLSLLAATSVHAGIVIGNDTSETTAEARGELLLMIWDPVKEVSYTKDLGLKAYAAELAIGNPAENLFVAGQQDAGYQKFWDALNGDSNFVKFLEKSTDKANQYWGIIGGSATADPGTAGSFTTFLTVKHDTATGVQNPQYNKLVAWNNEQLLADAAFLRLFATLNGGNQGANAAFNSHATSDNGSSFNSLGDAGYLGGDNFPNVNAGVGSFAPAIFNKVGSSSWFYHVTDSGGGTLPVAVDEFDNGVLGNGHDAYWGLGVDSNGNYILSYTLEASLTQTQTAQGQLLRLRTDFAASYGGTRLIGAPAGDTLDLGNPVSAVPEPSTWGLMGLGLAVLAGRARRHKRA